MGLRSVVVDVSQKKNKGKKRLRVSAIFFYPIVNTIPITAEAAINIIG